MIGTKPINNGEQFFYFFSSNSRDLYIQNMLNVLALPRDAISRVRYEARHIPAVLNRLPQESDSDYYIRLKAYRGCKALVIMLTQPKVIADKKALPDEKLRFYPLRYARITDLRPDGQVLYIYYALGSYVDWRDKVPGDQTFDAAIKASLDRVNRPPSSYVFTEKVNFTELEQNIPRSNDRDAALAWQALIEVLSTVADLTNTIYYRIVQLRNVKGHAGKGSTGNIVPPGIGRMLEQASSWVVRRADDMEHAGRGVIPFLLFLRDLIIRFSSGIVPITEILPDGNGYVLRSGQNYRMDLSFYQSREIHRSDKSELKEPVAGSVVRPILDKTYFAYLPSNIEMNFRYDTRSIDLVATVLNQDAYTTLGFTLEEKREASKQALNLALVPSAQGVYSPAIELAATSEEDEMIKLYGELQLPTKVALPSLSTVFSNLNVPAKLTILPPLEEANWKPPPDTSEIPVRTAEIELLLKLTYPRLNLTIAFIILLFAQLLVGLGGHLVDIRSWINQLTSWTLTEDDLKAWGLFATLLGSALTAVILFRLMRKVPGA